MGVKLIDTLRDFKRYIQEYKSRIYTKIRGYDDYFEFPFPISDPLNETADLVLEESCVILEELGIRYYLCDGTALGIVRDGRLIPHDNDIDVSVDGDIDIDRLKYAFSEKGYKIGRELYYKNLLQQIVFYSKSHVIFDIIIWRDGGDGFHYVYVPEVKNGRRQRNKYFSSQDFIQYKGKKYPTHAGIKDWLEFHYGKSWIVPEKQKGDWRDNLEDIVK
jgi:hypothetical protein